MRKSYILTRDIKCPVVATNQTAHKPAQIRTKTFRRGQVVQGELKHSDNKPAFVLVGRMCVIPIDAVKELQGKDIKSNYTGADMDETPVAKKPVIAPENPKIKYMDAFLIGALVGYLSVHIAEKKGYITSEDPKVKLYGAIGGALLGSYLVYRHQSSKPVITKKTTPTQ